MTEIFVNGTQDLPRAARTFLQHIGESRIIAFQGAMGAGKTTFITAVCEALGVKDVVCSPTFTIVQEYPTAPPLFHFDAYRLEDEDELYAMGFEDYLDRGGLILMEWADRVPNALPRERLDIEIVGSGAEERTVRLMPHGTTYEGLVSEL